MLGRSTHPMSAHSSQSLSKSDLHLLADGLILEDPLAIAACVAFIRAETKGVWHGRARAMMARRLKHSNLSSS